MLAILVVVSMDAAVSILVVAMVALLVCGSVDVLRLL